MKLTITIHKKNDGRLYGLLAWLIKATGKQRGAYNLDCLCLEGTHTTEKIRISATSGGCLHTVILPTPDCFNLSALPVNAKKQAVFHVMKTASSIVCLFDDTERVFPNVSSVLDASINSKLCVLSFDGLNAGDRSINLSVSIRKLYQAIDTKLNTIKGPNWNDLGIAIDYLKCLDQEDHNWVVYGSNKQTTLRFVHADGDVIKTALFQALLVGKDQSV